MAAGPARRPDARHRGGDPAGFWGVGESAHAGAGTVKAHEADLMAAYRAVLEARTVRWGSATVAPRELRIALESPDRRTRERAWRAGADGWREDGAALGDLWTSLVEVRSGGVGDQQYPPRLRTDVASPTPSGDAARASRLAVEEFVTSVLVRLHERRRRALGLRTFRPWDLLAPAPGFPSGSPFGTDREAVEVVCSVLQQLAGPGGPQGEPSHRASASLASDADLYEMVARMAAGVTPEPRDAGAQERLHAGVVLTMAVLHRDIFDRSTTSIRLHRVRSLIGYLEYTLLRWTYGAMIDSFEEWSYARLDGRPIDRAAAASTWSSLWLRFLPSVDWSGLEDAQGVEWQRHEALFLHPARSSARLAVEVNTFRGWMELAESTDPVSEIDRVRSLWLAPAAPGSILAEMELLDVARWIEDTIEHLERHRGP